MAIAATYPGVYVQEIPSGAAAISGVATSVTAFVGYTARGPIDKAVRLFNFGDFERTFGGLARDSEISVALSQFFLNGGTDAYVVRTAVGVQTATVNLSTSGGTQALIASAASPGSWGNSIRLQVDYCTSNPDNTFNLSVTRYELKNGAMMPAQRELHRNLSLNQNSNTYAVRVVNSDSTLIRLARSPGLTFPDKGFALSASLVSLPTLTAGDSTLDLIIDGKDRVTLVLASPAAANTLDKIKAAITAAASLAGVATRLAVSRADCYGADSVTGNFIKIASTDATEKSSIIVGPGTLASKLKLGATNGGREQDGAASRRPAASGTQSADLAAVIGTAVGGGMTITINDNSTGSPVALTSKSVTVPATTAGPLLRDKLAELVHSLDGDAASGATVVLSGGRLQVLPSATTPNASIVFTDGSGNGATHPGLTGTVSFANVQEYALSGGASFGAQSGSTPGNDGTPPDANALIGNYGNKTGIYALRDVDLFNLLVIPRTTQLADAEAKSVLAAAASFCEEERAFLLVDPAPDKAWSDMTDYVSSLGITSRNAAIYFPQIAYADPLDGFRVRNIPASGTVAGVISRTDANRGIWKAPAGTDAALRGAQGLSYTLTDQENGVLNQMGINCLRSFPVHGRIVWGARTMRGADAQTDEYKYIPVRRVALHIEESLFRGLQWAVFEPNDEPLWAQIRLNVSAFMHNLFRQGAFQGSSPRDAYFVKCDKETTTEADANLGIVNIVVGFAPLKPAEFVVLKLQQIAGKSAA